MYWLNGYRIRLLLIAFVAAIVLGSVSAKADFTFGEPTIVEAPINEDYRMRFVGCITADNLELYLDQHIGTWSSPTRWDIMVSTRSTTTEPWPMPVSVGAAVNNGTFNYTPSISNDGLKLYFDSDRSGGHGGQDIWVTTRPHKDASWATPVNLGPPFNTASHDGYPYVSSNGLEFYFSTNRAGGWDIWVSKRQTQHDDWGTPENLGAPVNTNGDEFLPSLSPDGLILFFCDGTNNMCMSRRKSTAEPWQASVRLGYPLNSSKGDFNPRVSPDGRILYFSSHRPGVYKLEGKGWHVWQAPIIPIVDFDGDGNVGFEDLLRLADSWCCDDTWVDVGPMPWGDGLVNGVDLAVLMSYWGQQVSYTPDMRVDFTLAWNPKPADGYTTDVEKALPLTWTPGDRTALQDVYLGTDRVAVEAADTSDTSGIYRGRQDSSDYAPPEDVEAGQTYYWRIDAFRPGAPTSKGKIWTFTVADYLIVDGFETYDDDWETDAGMPIWKTWIDGWTNGTGSTAGYLYPPFAEWTIVHTGNQSMPLHYDNDGTMWEGTDYETSGLALYSEAQREWEVPQDWTRKGVEKLVLWFCGDPANAIGPFYVGLEDAAGNRKDIPHPDPAAVTVDEWQQWSIPLANFTGVDLTAIKIMSIGVGDPASTEPGGSGKLCIDDIQLRRP